MEVVAAPVDDERLLEAKVLLPESREDRLRAPQQQLSWRGAAGGGGAWGEAGRAACARSAASTGAAPWAFFATTKSTSIRASERPPASAGGGVCSVMRTDSPLVIWRRRRWIELKAAQPGSTASEARAVKM